jgi:hypothetical protein
MLAPIGYIRRKAGGSGVLSSYRADEIANELKVSPWIVTATSIGDATLFAEMLSLPND